MFTDSRRSLSCCLFFLLIVCLGCLLFLIILRHGRKHLGKASLLSFSESLLFILCLCQLTLGGLVLGLYL